MKNRYGVVYDYKKVNDNTYLFDFPKEEMKYYRAGFKEHPDSLEFIDPSGGPFIGIGMPINGKKVSRIYFGENQEVFLDVV